MLRLFPATGHAPHWEAPEGFAQLVQCFAQETVPQRASLLH
jgi:pimeloyl-ACP methyl ester carboxylesterase